MAHWLLLVLSISCYSLAVNQQKVPEWCQTLSETTHNKEISFQVGIQNSNIEEIIEAGKATSDPSSPLYGKFWTHEQVLKKTANPKSLSFVLNFFQKHSFRIESISKDFMWVNVIGSVTKTEEIFQTKCSFFNCNNEKTIRCSHHEIPDILSSHIDYVGTIDFPEEKNEKFETFSVPKQRTYSSVNEGAWPSGPYLDMNAIKKLYSIDPSLTVNHPNTSAAVFEVNAPSEYYNPSDVTKFLQLSGLPIQSVSQFKGDQVTFGCPSLLCAEPVLDVEMLIGIATGINLTYWTTNVKPAPYNILLQFLINLAADPSPSWIHSMSWGPAESHISASTANRMDQEFSKLTLKGLTFVTSSGDDGVNIRKARGNPTQCGLSPQYPATSPWVTTLGGTFGPEYGLKEQTCKTNSPGYHVVITSGGGFSMFYPQPDYQKKFVQSYLQKARSSLPPSFTYNSSNRAYPDISLIANNIDTIMGGNFIPGAGTSASAPLFAGMLALILDARFQSGQGPFGSLNPSLYSLASSSPSIFNDITIGDNHCTALYGRPRTYTCCPYGFNATEGWDPVTGLGSVNFHQLKKALLTIGKKKQL